MATAPPPPRNVTAQLLIEKIKDWDALKLQASILKEKEMALRLEIVDLAFPALKNNPDLKGTLTNKLPDGSEIKTEAKFNIKVDDEVLAASKDDLITEELIPIDLIFNYKPSLVAANYDKLTSEQKVKLADIVSFERATPSLKYIPAKPVEKIVQDKPVKGVLSEDDKPF